MCSGYYIYKKLYFSKELPTERELSKFVDCHAVAMKKDPSDNVPSECLEVILLTS